MNQGVIGIPRCLFYADDGILVVEKDVDIQKLLDEIYTWAVSEGLKLNVRKCGYLSQLSFPPRLYVGTEALLRTQEYQYLGFPMKARGIDFNQHLEARATAMVQRMRFFARDARGWGIAHRLRIAKQYFLPIMEFGAPLVWAWKVSCDEVPVSWKPVTKRYRELLEWISDLNGNSYKVLANLLGLTTWEQRFKHLHTAFQETLKRQDTESPLRQILVAVRRPRKNPKSFERGLQYSKDWQEYQKLVTDPNKKWEKRTIQQFLRKERRKLIERNAKRARLTKLIPWVTRKAPGMGLADRCLAAPNDIQRLFFQYRLGKFIFGRECKCGSSNIHRGHEKCSALDSAI